MRDPVCDGHIIAESATLRVLGPDHTPLRVPTGLGKEIDHWVELAANNAHAIRIQVNKSPAGFASAVMDLRHRLITIAGEIARLREKQVVCS